LGRNVIHIDLNPEYLQLAIGRIGPLLVDVKEVAA
jgi:DNA modification methylase